MRNVVLLPSFALGAAFALAAGFALSSGGCSATDPGEIDCLGALPIPGMARAGDCSGPLIVYASDAAPVTTTTTDATTSTPPPDAASGDDAAATDEGGDASTTTAPEFVGDTFDVGEQPGNQSTNSDHNFDGGSMDPFGQVCQTCHAAGTGSVAASDVWTIGGSIVKGVGGPPYSAPVEVRVIGPDGGVYAGSYSDTNGNFWVELSPATSVVPAGSHVAIRTATSTMVMADPLSSGSCNAAGGCHGSASPGPIYIP